MTDPKFTPGPWTVSELNASGDVSEFHIFIEPGVAVIERKVDGHNDSDMPDARLIAAAPELLEACQKLAEWDAREKDHAISFRERIDMCDAAFKLMNAAIAKATGAAQ